MLKHLLIGTLAFSSLALAVPRRLPPPPPPPSHAAVPIVAPAPQFNRGQGAQREERLEARRAEQLLRDFDAAVARRDRRAVDFIDRQFSGVLDQELREARRDHRGSRGQVARLSAIASDLNRLQGHMDRRSLTARRGLYAEVARIAAQEVRGDRRF